MRQFSSSDHSRSPSSWSRNSGTYSTHSDISTNPFRTPGTSIHNPYPQSQAGGGSYFRSRRIRKDDGHVPPQFKKTSKEKWLTIMPLTGIFVGLCITGVLIYFKIGRLSHYNYCSVLDDSFSSETLNPSIWTIEQETGGFGNAQFEMTTAENVFIENGKLYIKPTLQDATLIDAQSKVNLTKTGVCTAVDPANCVAATNFTLGTIVNPVKSARINTKTGATIKYGKVEVTAKLPKGDWLWPAIWMLPVNNVYGDWPASGEIDIMETRGNNYTYSLGGGDVVTSSLHWGPAVGYDAYARTGNFKKASHAQWGDQFHTFGLEWTEKYLFTYIDTKLMQVFYWDFKKPFYGQGDFPFANANGTRLSDPWGQTGRPQTPFDQEFYLIINVAVGGENGWFKDGSDGKPWLDTSPTARLDFWKSRDQWYPTWEKDGQMVVDRVQMWQKC